MTIHNLSVHELHDKLSKKELSSVEITKAFLKRIDEVESQVEAFVTVCEKEALEQAAKVDEKIKKGEKLSPLAGIPSAIKDNICTKGIRTTCSSKILSNFVPPYDASVMEKLKSHDSVMIGKTNMDEFAMGGATETSYFKKTKNPWDLTRAPGGSSGGSASAIAAGQAAWALGSDTGGSVRQPAAFTNTVGMKPTYGRISRSGCVALASSLDQIGTITKDVRDCAIVLNSVCGYCPQDSNSYNGETPDFTKALVTDVKGMKIGLVKEFNIEGLDKAVEEKFHAAVKHLEGLGAQVVELSIPHAKYTMDLYSIIMASEAGSNMSKFDGVKYGYREKKATNINDLYVKSRTEGFGLEVRSRIIQGYHFLSNVCYEEFYLKAIKVRTLLIQDVNKAFEKVDVIATPGAPTIAFKLGSKLPEIEKYQADLMHAVANMAGLPALSIPCGFVQDMPVGIHFLGKVLDENSILKAAYTYEQSTDFHKKIAPVGGK